MLKFFKSIIVSAALILCATSAFAGITKGPYLLFEGANTSMSVLWQTTASETNTLRWGTDTSYSLGQTTVGVYGTAFQHKYTITGLQPDTKYFYEVVGYGSGSFRTAPAASATAVKLLAYGDTRSTPAQHELVAGKMRAAYAADPAFQTIVLQGGDWINTDAETNWTNEWFVSGTSYPQMHTLQAEVPITGARGNHEGTGAVYKKYFPEPYVAGFYRSFDYGPVHVTVVDQYTSYTSGSAQYNWIVSDLAATTKPWKIVVLHEPGWTAAGSHANNTTVQTVLQPLFEQYGVQMVIGGHNHYYARGVVNGVQHLTLGGGGAPLYTPASGQPNIVKTSQSYHHGEIDINGTSMVFTARTSAGAVIETFTVTNGPANQSPVANAGVDQSVTDTDANGSQAVTLNGSASSDPDGSIASWVWKEGTTQIATGANPAVTLAVGTHTITLTVTDNGGATAIDTVVVTVNAAPAPPVTPAGLSATAGNAQVSLSWSASAGATSYNVKSSTTTGGPYTTIATGVTTTSYTNTGLTNGTAYYYVVSAVNAYGESANSAQASATPTATVTPVTVTSAVVAGTDDVEQRQTGGTMYTNSSDLELVYDTATTGNQFVGIRFKNVNVPKGKTITNAYIQFTVDEVTTAAASLTIKGQAADNPGTFTTAANNVSSRATTAASVAWTPAAWSTIDAAGTAQRTPELKTIVQEVVNRAAWTANNAMVFVITGTGKRTARAYESAAAKAPKLVVTYQ